MTERKGTKALELWCKRLIRDCPDIRIENMSTSWRDGMAFCALVHHFRPDLMAMYTLLQQNSELQKLSVNKFKQIVKTILCKKAYYKISDYLEDKDVWNEFCSNSETNNLSEQKSNDMSKLKCENIYENNQLAFSVAEKHLGIPALLDPEDMVENDVPDRLSILTYLSQFYQRLGHTVNNKVSESEVKTTESPSEASGLSAPIKFGKTGLDKCTACGLPVYLAQRLMVSHKLYHRRCFRCSKCSGHLNPKNFHVVDGSEFLCDSCKNDKNLMKYLNNNDHNQMGMLAFNDNLLDAKVNVSTEEIVISKTTPRPTSILDKISMFEKKLDKDVSSKIDNIPVKDSTSSRFKDISSTSGTQSETDSKLMPENIKEKVNIKSSLHKDTESNEENNPMHISPLDKDFKLLKIQNEDENNEVSQNKNITENLYKSNIEKYNFLQTQLANDSIEINKTESMEPIELTKHKEKDCMNENDKKTHKDEFTDIKETVEDHNITDDIRIAKIPSNNLNKDVEIQQETTISVPPRRKKQNATEKKPIEAKSVVSPIIYPDHLNPFSDDEEEESIETNKKVSTNPFGSSDEDDDGPPVQPPKIPSHITSTPEKRLIAVNPFWSDGEEPSSEDEDISYSKSSMSGYSSMATSTPNLRSGTPRRMKPKAPPPPVITVTESSRSHTTSMDDLASISSLGSCNSTVNSEQRTPLSRRKGPAPTPPPDSLSTVSEGGSMDKTADSDLKNASGSDCGKKAKGPAPGLPLPERREVKLQMSPEELQVQLDLLETQQLGLERQGVLIERMIRDKCEGDEACTAPQEEVEDLVIQLCELVNEKNDLFRKQTELMYIRRQQRLEQEQADIEHEIRIIQSRPAVNRIDADKAREEQLVTRLVEIVRLRDELVQQLDAERRRERQEDLAIAMSIASKRAQRSSDASLKSVDTATTQKKNKVKDKMKKQFKKAKHTLYSKKKDTGDSSERKEGKEGKMDKSK